MSKSHLTAIARKQLSTPASYLVKHDLLKGRLFDFGCGKGFDADHLGMDKYDPNHFPDGPSVPMHEYDTVMCNYVLNVIEDEAERLKAEQDIVAHLNQNGTAFVSVRNDKKFLNGLTTRGTWQGYVVPVLDGWELVTKNSRFRMYRYQMGVDDA